MELEIESGSDDERLRPGGPRPAVPFKIELPNGKSVRMSVNDLTYFESHEEPLAGPGHEHFGFND